ncbi:MAG: phenylalanine--tRNA ligase subunit beta [Monoglobales bacterium]
MKLPMSWLSDYTDIEGISPKEYADKLTMTGSKVEGVEYLGAELDKVVAGKVLSCEMHPDSDHLHVCMVDVGEEEPLQIVCGAPNVAEGQMVPVALNGAVLPGGVKIKKGKLRGVVSNGMICSHEEMGISESLLGYEPEYGILVLPDDVKPGTDVKDLYGLNENVVEFEITSNRPDCFSIIGLARETAVSFKKSFKIPEVTFHETSDKITDKLSIDVQDKDKCLRYTSRMIKNVKIGPSPKWMRERLEACGIRSINNMVDITNYVLLEYGQPMHAFDLRHLEGGKIIVRRANDGEMIKTLDEQDRKLTSDDLVICDAVKPVAIAGVMGGFNSEIKPDTTEVAFESATFDAASVRLTAQRVGLRTEASSRYEKGLDYNNTVPAIERACQLVEELGCGEVVGGAIDVIGNVKDAQPIMFRPEKINAFLGTDISTDEMVEILTSLEVKIDMENMMLTPPSFRPDLVAEADIAEEIARFHGYDIIPTTLLSGESVIGMKNKEQNVEDKINEVLTAQGMSEIYTYTFVSPSIFDKLNIPAESPLRNTVKITNPLGEDTSVMRTTTIASMMEVLARNYNYRTTSAKMFETAKIFIPTEAGKLPEEPVIITLGMYGENADFFTIKGVCEVLFEQLHIDGVSYIAVTDNPTYHPGRCAEIKVGNKILGTIGEIHPSVSRKFGIDTECYVGELNLENILATMNDDVKYHHLPKYPAVTRDFSILLDKITPVAEIEAVIGKAAGKLLDKLELSDVYEGHQIPEGKKSVMYKAAFRADDRSLTGEEADNLHDKIVKKLENALGAQLR